MYLCQILINTIKMKNFKVTNLKSKVVQFMNESETKQFFTKNSLGNYKRENVQTLKREGEIKLYDNILFTLGSFIVFYILIFAMCYTFSFIDSLIF